MKYVLTTSDDNHVIIAQVDDKYRKQKPNEVFLSTSTLQANVKAGKFTDISDRIDYEYKVWMLKEDIG